MTPDYPPSLQLRLRRLARLGVILGCCLLMPAAGTAAPELPFSPGEKLTFRLRWELVPAGTTTLMVVPEEAMAGQQVNHLVLITETNSFVDLFYKVRDRFDSLVNHEVTQTIFYGKHQREGRTNRKITVRFDWKRKQATYSNFDKEIAPISVPDGTMDPLASFYFLRTQVLEPGMVITRPVTDGKRVAIGKATVLARERITVPAGTFDTLRLEPDSREVGGVFEKSRDSTITLWVTDDRRHIPVKIKSRVVVGSFTGELIEAQGLQEVEPDS